MKKRLIALVLTLCVAVSMIAPASAVSGSNKDTVDGLAESISLDSFSKAERDEIARQLNKLVELGILESENSKLIKIENKKENNRDAKNCRFIFTVDYGIFCEAIDFLANDSDKVSLHVVGDNAENVLTIFSSGKIFLDGNEVVITYGENSADEDQVLKNGITGTKSSDRWFQYGCPYGTANDYSTYVSAQNVANINMNNALKNVTFTVAVAIVTSLNPSFSLGLTLTSIVWSFIVDMGPDSYGISYKATKYRHKNSPAGGYISQIRQYVHKWNIKWYAKENYKFYVTSNTQYEIHMIY